MSKNELENYSFIRALGNGTYGWVTPKTTKNLQFLTKALDFRDVKLFRDSRTNQKVVIKTIKLLTNNISVYDVAKEILIMSKLDHSRVVRFLTCFEDRCAEKLNIVMEYASGGTLHALIEEHSARKTHLPQKLILRLFCELLMGIDYLHLRHVIHCDLKPENVLLDSNMRVKIGDFGISLISSHPSKPVEAVAFGTPIYMAPEVYTTRSYSAKSDVWALGVILYEMCTLKPPFMASNLENLARIIHSGDFQPIPYASLGYDMHLQVIAKMMILPNATQRCTVNAVICHPFITKPFYETLFA